MGPENEADEGERVMMSGGLYTEAALKHDVSVARSDALRDVALALGAMRSPDGERPTRSEYGERLTYWADEFVAEHGDAQGGE